MAQTKHQPDLTKISLREYRSLIDKSLTDEEEDAIMARILGFKDRDDMLDNMDPLEYRKAILKMFEMMRNPVESDEKN